MNRLLNIGVGGSFLILIIAPFHPLASSKTVSSQPSGSEGPACIVPAGLDLQDQDFSDSQLPWERKGANRVEIYFETRNVTPEYLSHMQRGVEAWNRSPCLETRLVNSCPPKANCVTVSLDNRKEDIDGNFDSTEKNDFTVGGHITFYTKSLNNSGNGSKLNVAIHEMGHAVGLRHRSSKRVLMNYRTYEDIFYPDEIDFQNLLVLYGGQR